MWMIGYADHLTRAFFYHDKFRNVFLIQDSYEVIPLINQGQFFIFSGHFFKCFLQRQMAFPASGGIFIGNFFNVYQGMLLLKTPG